jgi:hypothetical protein
MPAFVLLFVFLPGAWIVYGISRWILSNFDLTLSDKVALSFLAAIAYLLGHSITAWDMRVTGKDRKPS